MNTAKFARSIITMGAVAGASATMSIASFGIERLVFGIFTFVMVVLLAVFVAARESLFAHASAHREDRVRGPASTGQNRTLSLLPINRTEWAMFVIFGLFALVLAAAIASETPRIGPTAALFGISIYAALSGYVRLRKAYYHRDRMLLLCGEELVIATTLGLVASFLVS